jgi:hypothetical protein
VPNARDYCSQNISTKGSDTLAKGAPKPTYYQFLSLLSVKQYLNPAVVFQAQKVADLQQQVAAQERLKKTQKGSERPIESGR